MSVEQGGIRLFCERKSPEHRARGVQSGLSRGRGVANDNMSQLGCALEMVAAVVHAT